MLMLFCTCASLLCLSTKPWTKEFWNSRNFTGLFPIPCWKSCMCENWRVIAYFLLLETPSAEKQLSLMFLREEEETTDRQTVSSEGWKMSRNMNGEFNRISAALQLWINIQDSADADLCGLNIILHLTNSGITEHILLDRVQSLCGLLKLVAMCVKSWSYSAGPELKKTQQRQHVSWDKTFLSYFT